MKRILVLLALVTLASCKSLNTPSKALVKVTDKLTGDTYYTEQVYIDFGNDSIYFAEFKRNGEIRRNGAFPVSQVIVDEKN